MEGHMLFVSCRRCRMGRLGRSGPYLPLAGGVEWDMTRKVGSYLPVAIGEEWNVSSSVKHAVIKSIASFCNERTQRNFFSLHRFAYHHFTHFRRRKRRALSSDKVTRANSIWCNCAYHWAYKIGGTFKSITITQAEIQQISSANTIDSLLSSQHLLLTHHLRCNRWIPQ